VIIGAGWRACTAEDGNQEGSGCFDYEKDGVRYVEDIARWLDCAKVHPCNGEDALKGFQLDMGLLRSVVEQKMLFFRWKKVQTKLKE
jgi:hypothetical protein